ncbi:MAG: 23S rRNA (guanosine(2251)-2'-O)-methyltransferase RlmB [Gammaproteobacteria bacterium]|jgi:23S rRNA (guanosine2251-2'-O)-methyltransferase|nr:23S rRNA (guanosine(2251)-2'-O)-methyltransferase RlmB [Gammaproteobacteria bacterium]
MSKQQEWVWGIHAVGELLRQRAPQVLKLVLLAGRSDERINELQALAREAGLTVEEADRRQLDRLAEGNHQGALALCDVNFGVRSEKQLTAALDALGDRAPLILVLDGITDPHNFGACLRSADAAGVDAVIVPKDKSAPLNATVRKVACGAAETVPVYAVTNLARSLAALKDRGIWLAGLAGEGAVSLTQQDLTGPLGIVMGSEGEGLRRLTRDACDYLVSIPMAGSVSSLNVSVATGVTLFEAARQRSS